MDTTEHTHTHTHMHTHTHAHIRPETIKLLEENIGKTLSDINHSKILYDSPPRVMEIKAKINKWDLIKLKSFCTGESGLVLSEEGNPAGLSSCSGGLRPPVELCVEPAGLCATLQGPCGRSPKR